MFKLAEGIARLIQENSEMGFYIRQQNGEIVETRGPLGAWRKPL